MDVIITDANVLARDWTWYFFNIDSLTGDNTLVQIGCYVVC